MRRLFLSTTGCGRIQRHRQAEFLQPLSSSEKAGAWRTREKVQAI